MFFSPSLTTLEPKSHPLKCRFSVDKRKDFVGLWNSLPPDVGIATSLGRLKRGLDKFSGLSMATGRAGCLSVQKPPSPSFRARSLPCSPACRTSLPPTAAAEAGLWLGSSRQWRVASPAAGWVAEKRLGGSRCCLSTAAPRPQPLSQGGAKPFEY